MKLYFQWTQLVTLSSSICVSLIFIDISLFLALILLIVLLITIILKTLVHLYNVMDQTDNL